MVVFPTSGGRFWEYEDRGMVDALAPKIDRGELQVICLDSVDQESWYNKRAIRPTGCTGRTPSTPTWRMKRRRSSATAPVGAQMGTTGCSFGGYHAINFALRHPDIVTYAVSMSGAFNIPKRFLDGYYNQNAYFHSPLDYLPRSRRSLVPGANPE